MGIELRAMTFGLSASPRFPGSSPAKALAAEVSGMAPNRHYKCRKQDRGSGNQDKQLGDRVSLNRSTSLKDHGARGMGEYAYGAEPDSHTISSLHSVCTPLQCCAAPCRCSA